VLEVARRATAAQLLVAGGKALGLRGDWSTEVLLDGKIAATIDPALPVEL
jgi:hypothetical protein